MRRRRPAARRRRATTGIRGIEKVYRYKFNPTAQYLISNTAGTILQVNPPGTSTSSVGWGSLTAIPSASTIPNYFDFGTALTFSLTNITTAAAYTKQYDNYRIRGITLTLDLLQGGASSGELTSGGTPAPGILPTVWAFADQDDNAVPLNQYQVAARQGAKRFKFGQNGKMTFSIKVAPKVGLSTGVGGSGTGQASNILWLDCAYPTQQYYGIKLWFSDVNMDGLTNYGFRCNWTYDVEFKGAQNLF